MWPSGARPVESPETAPEEFAKLIAASETPAKSHVNQMPTNANGITLRTARTGVGGPFQGPTSAARAYPDGGVFGKNWTTLIPPLAGV